MIKLTNPKASQMKIPQPTASDFTPCPAGNHLAVCCRLIDLGTQESLFNGKPKRQRKVFIEWQVQAERTNDNEAVVVGKRYTLSSSEKSNLRKDLESWRGRRFNDTDFGDVGFDLKNILLAPCCLSVVHEEREGEKYANVQSVAAIPKGTPRPELEGTTAYLSLKTDEFGHSVYSSLSDRLRATIALSPEFQAIINEPDVLRVDSKSDINQVDVDSIPF